MAAIVDSSLAYALRFKHGAKLREYRVFSSNEWLQLYSAPASKRLHTLVTRSLQLGCKRPSENTLTIFWSTVTAARMLWEHDQTHFDDAKYVDLRFAVVGGDVKRPITALRALPHVSYLKPELETLLALVQNALVLQQEINEDTELTTFLTELVDQVVCLRYR